ncbi:MAG: VanW family protein [Polyangiaceae bacterium]
MRAHAAFFPDGEVLPGLTIEHRAVTGSVSEAVAGAARNRVAQEARFQIDGDTVLDASFADLGVSVDETRTASVARAIGHEGDLASRADQAKRATRGEIDVPLAMRVDPSRLLALLAPVKELRDQAPTSARVDFDHGGAKAEAPGRYIDIDAAILELTRIAAMPTSSEPRIITLSTRDFAPHLVSNIVRDIDVSQTLSSFDTFFSRAGGQLRRGKNIDVAASKLDGIVLMPNELVSFNDVVGPRNEDNGFSKSWEIYKGEMVEGIGGGTCQVASTLHATAFFGGLDIVERLPHSRPSAYIPMGLDATVVFPVVDMKLKNPYPFPVVVHATSDGPRLHMELRGKKRLAHVTFSREVKRILPYDRKIEEKAGVSLARVIVKQHGVDGFKIERKRVVEFFDGKKHEEKENDTYPPTNEVLEVAPGFDVALLPPLPDPPPADPTEAPTPPPAAATVAAASESTTPAGVEGYVMQDAPGAHPPTQAQQSPELLVTIKR